MTRKDMIGLAGVAAILALPTIGYGLLAGEDRLVRFFPDDAFYYLQPAYHFARTGFPSFDGLHFTNGFHPLNFLVAAAETRFLSKPALLAAMFVTDAVVLALAVLLAVASIRPRSDGRSCVLLALLLSPPLAGPIVYNAGTEASLVVLATVLLVIAFESALSGQLRSGRRNFLLGAAMSAFLFARLDNVIAIAPLVLLLPFAGARFGQGQPAAARLRTLAAVFWLPVVLGIAYLALNYCTTGHLVPISGHVKQTTDMPLRVSWHAVTGGHLLWSLLGIGPLVLSVAVLAAVARLWPGDDPRRRARRWAVAAVNAGNVLFYLYLFFFASNFFRWYLALPIACTIVNVVFLAASCEALLPPRAKTGWPAARLTAVLLVAASMAANVALLEWLGNRPNTVSYRLKNVAELVDRHGGAEAVTGVFDAGVIGYFAHGTVINLDGLANDFDYYDNYLRRGRLREYFQAAGITHFLVRDCYLENLQEVERGEYQTAVFRPDPRIVLRRDRELFRYTLPGSFTVYYFALEQP